MDEHSLIFWRTRFHEAGGAVITFGDGTNKAHRSILRIHHSSFYWKVKFKFQLEFKNSLTKFQWLKIYPHEQIATRGDLGLADAYIDGDFTCADTGAGLFNLFMVPWFHSEVFYQVKNIYHIVVINMLSNNHCMGWNEKESKKREKLIWGKCIMRRNCELFGWFEWFFPQLESSIRFWQGSNRSCILLGGCIACGDKVRRTSFMCFNLEPGSLRLTFVPARLVGLAVKPFCLCTGVTSMIGSKMA